MKFFRLGRKKWTVLAFAKARHECPVLDLLRQSGKPGNRMFADLREVIPERGPPRNPEQSKALRDGILELREPVSNGGTLRILYFYDKGCVVVCANGCLKKQNRTPDELIDAAIAIRREYLSAVLQGRLQIDDLPADLEADDGDRNDD